MRKRSNKTLNMAVVIILLISMLSPMTTAFAAPGGAIWGESPVAEPYPYVSQGSFSGREQPCSPDPLVAYRWDAPKASDGLEIFLRKPLSADCETPENFAGMESLTTGAVNVNVTGAGTIRMDFGAEYAAWLEIDSPDLTGDITLGVSEYNQPALVNWGPQSPSKTATPKKYGNTYRLELNGELYEGARFGFINIERFDKPFHITGVRLVCQTKPVNYNASFDSDNEMLNKIWYTAAYDVRANLKADYIAAIIVDRGDRHSWTGDAYPSQAASLTAFANYDFVLDNMRYTAVRKNGIESYEMYWIYSLIDYYEYTGDKEGVLSLLDQAAGRLDIAYNIYGKNPSLAFFGWDERLGAGFENPNIAENQNSYKLLAIKAWDEFSDVLDELGRGDLAAKYRGYAAEKTQQLQSDPDFYKTYGMHAVSDAINAGILPQAVMDELAEYHYTDRLNRLSYSPFNQYFILQAMAKAGRYDDAISSILDLWGGQIAYGGTTFFETFRPGWNDIVEKNGPVPNNQSGYTSLAHPWGAGVLTWLTEEVLGIKATAAGFASFEIKPHLGRQLTRVSGDMLTPHGTIEAAFDTQAGTAHAVIPDGTTATVAIPKVEKTVSAVKVNGIPASMADQDDDFVYLHHLASGSYDIAITYAGQTPSYEQPEYIYPAAFVGADFETKGNWSESYGADGYVLCAYAGSDYRMLPSYVNNVRYNKAIPIQWPVEKDDPLALANNAFGIGGRKLAGYKTNDYNACWQTFTVDIDLVADREYTVALYFADWDQKGRELCVEMFDGKTLNLVAPLQALHDYTGGVYLVYQYDRSARFRIDQIRGDNVTLSGIFFGEGGAEGQFPDIATDYIDDQDARIQYEGGGWTHSNISGAYAGTFSYNKTPGAAASLTFEADNITYIASRESNRGMVDVYLDDQYMGRFDLYTADMRRQEKIFAAENLGEGEHTIKVVTTGEKNPIATDCYIDLDAFAINGKFVNIQQEMLDDRDARVQFNGNWTHDPMAGAYNGTFSYSNLTGNYAELTFNGTGVAYIASREFNRGIADIYIDGVLKESVDLYSAQALRIQRVFEIQGLEAGEHTIKIMVSGNKNPSASGAYVDIDAFEITSELYNIADIAQVLKVKNPQAGDRKIEVLPKLPAAFHIELAASSDTGVITMDGAIIAPAVETQVTLTFKVSSGASVAQRDIIVTVPAAVRSEHAVTVSVSGEGSAQADKETAVFGETVALSRQAGDGWRFKEWRAIEPADLEIRADSFIMPDCDVSVEAVFEEDTGNSIPVASVKINASGLFTLSIKKKAQIPVTIEPADATDQTVKWISTNTNIFTVDKDGNITPKKQGTATLTAQSSNGLKSTIIVRITA